MDLIALKVMAASVAMILVVLQGLIMLHVYGKAQLFPVRTATLTAWHRRQGDVLLVLFVLVAYHCVTRTAMNWRDWRPVAHAVSAVVALAAVGVKLLMVQAFPRTMRYITPVGLVLFIAALGATGTTVVWYFYTWAVWGIRPGY